MGTTTVPCSEFEEWCHAQTANGTYAAAAYDLFDHNCNHFSHHALQHALQLKEAGVPSYILYVPKTFLASPFGQMMRPMMAGMQVNGGVPFVAVPRQTAASCLVVPNVDCSATSRTETAAIQQNTAHKRANSEMNPWAGAAPPSSDNSDFSNEKSPKKQTVGLEKNENENETKLDQPSLACYYYSFYIVCTKMFEAAI